MSTSSLLSGPHTHSRGSVSRIMLLVLLALLPATAYGVYLFGWPALNLLILSIVSAVLFEAFGLWIGGKPLLPFLSDGSAVLTGWLLAMSLPPWSPWWIAVLGSAFAIIIGKQVFGGIGQNLFNPAMLARVTLLIAFPLEMTSWTTPLPMGSANAPDFMQGLAITFGGAAATMDAVSSATLLGHLKTELTQGHSVNDALVGYYDFSSAAIGNISGSMGETSAVLLLLGGLLLLAKRIIRWHIPVAMMGTVALLATLFHLIDPVHYAGPFYHLLSGGMILGAFFIATDLVTSPSSYKGQIIFGAGCGALTYIIRTWGGYPEAVGFAVLLMNAVTPLIDHYVRPRIYGHQRDGSPIAPKKGEEKA